MTQITYRDEHVLEVESRTNRECFEAASALLAQFQPTALTGVEPVELVPLLDSDVVITHSTGRWSGRRSSISIYEGTEGEMDGRKAFTNFSHDYDFVDVVLSGAQFNDLLSGGAIAHQPRATVAHELGHATMHGPSVWGRARSSMRMQLSRLKPWGKIPPYKNPELQAWAFARCLLMPLSAMRQMDDLSPECLADTFKVSRDLAKRHIEQLRDRKIVVDGRVQWVPASADLRQPLGSAQSHPKACQLSRGRFLGP